jgi:hypothetical protein
MLVPRGVNCHHPHHRFAGVMRARRSQTRQLVTGGAWCGVASPTATGHATIPARIASTLGITNLVGPRAQTIRIGDMRPPSIGWNGIDSEVAVW